VTTPAPTVTDFHTQVGWLKREVAVPGTFATVFPNTTDEDLAMALVDGFYKARLDGWLPGVECDPDTAVPTPAISMAAMALVVVYSGIKFVSNQIKELNTVFRAKSGNEEFETQKGPSILVERLKEMQAEKNDLLVQARKPTARPVYMHDGYAIRLGTLYPVEAMARVPYRYEPAIELT